MENIKKKMMFKSGHGYLVFSKELDTVKKLVKENKLFKKKVVIDRASAHEFREKLPFFNH